MKKRPLSFLKSRCVNERGVSLLEMILVFSFLSIVTLVVFDSIHTTQRIFDRGSSEAQEQGSLRNTMSILKRDVHEGRSGTDTPGSCDTENPDGVCIHTSPAVLSFKVPEQTEGAETSFKTVRYSYDATAKTLLREAIPSSGPPATSSAIVGRNLTSVVFSQPSASVVSINLSTLHQSLLLHISLRNNPGE